ncbi:hypothetical protein [Clostridium porci]|uniref:Uncharacterized protein n=1 Tax=Clostridium porci TaxID=2605778 RepID=A0A7X2TEK3_9CLOT|nr:hypothetical protein [Clostridium porci]MSS38318.1 hypothetical protein [Clostridium porci]
MRGVAGSKHWAQDIIYRVLMDGKVHSFDEILCEITEIEHLRMTRCNLSCVLTRLKQKRGDIIQVREGYFQLDTKHYSI